MRRLNAAYRCLLEAARLEETPPEPPATPSDGPVARPYGRRLTREEIDAMVASMGSSSWIDWVVEAVPGGSRVERLLEWLFERRRLGPWEVMRATAMGTVVVAGYVLYAAFALSGVDVRRRSVESFIGGGMVMGVAMVAYAMRDRPSR
jgi:hypothetical protein